MISPEAKREYDRAYRDRPGVKDRERARQAARYTANRESPEFRARRKAYAARYHVANRTRLNLAAKAWRQRLPPIVYRWISPDGYTAYVGRGTIQRAMSHSKYASWFQKDMILRTQQCRNEWHAMRAEGLWGELFRPRFNKEGYRH